jgi:hypothetical protein
MWKLLRALGDIELIVRVLVNAVLNRTDFVMFVNQSFQWEISSTSF